MKTLGKPFAVGRTAEVYAWEDGAVLKLYRDWCPSNWADYEGRIARLVSEAGVPSPKGGEIVEIDGRRGIVYERVDGPDMLAQMSRSPVKVIYFAHMLADLHFEMHQHPALGFPCQQEQLERSIQAAKTLPEDLRAQALQVLAGLPRGDRLCHGDFHPMNVILTKNGPMTIDWMTASQGDPASDVARTSLLLTFGDPPSGAARLLLKLVRNLYYRSYFQHYQRLAPQVTENFHRWQFVQAAARLNEDIASEREKTLQFIRDRMARL